MNLDAIAATNRVSYALTLQNTSIRRFPSSDRVFASAEDQSEDLFLQAPLVIGEPVVVLHTSADQTWYYVQLRNCRGWVYWSDLVFLEKSAWVSYIESTELYCCNRCVYYDNTAQSDRFASDALHGNRFTNLF